MGSLNKILAVLISLMVKNLSDPMITEVTDDVYDFIVVGSGPGGSTVASRLSEIPNVTVLLLEAGESDLKEPRIKVPAKGPGLQGSHIDWKYETEPQAYPPYTNRTFRMPRGKTLGGTSSINYSLYFRGSPHDFDSWKDSGAEGWDWKDVLPYFHKIENATSDELAPELSRDGYLKLTRNHMEPSKAWNLFARAASELGYKTTDYTSDVEGLSPLTSSIYEGMRQNAATAYLRPVYNDRKDRLHVVTGALVSEIVFEKGSLDVPKAHGVKYIKNGKHRTVKVRKEVVLSAGAIGTPQILLLSGVGPKEDLEKLNIPVIVNSPGVGSNLQNHGRVGTNFITDISNPQSSDPQLNYVLNGEGTMSEFPHTCLFTRSPYSGTPTSLSTKKRPFPDIQILIAEGPLPKIGFLSYVAHPKSQGTIKLRSKDIRDYPAINPHFLEHEDDMRLFIEAFRIIERFEETSAFQNASAEMILSEACNGSLHKIAPRKEEYYRCLLYMTSLAGNHQCCTAKMGAANDKYAVVDSNLRVFGVEGLRVADASVMPHITSGNTQAPTYMIGEKAADMIKEYWNI